MRLSQNLATVGGNEALRAHAAKDEPLAKNGVNQSDDKRKDSCSYEIRVHAAL